VIPFLISAFFHVMKFCENNGSRFWELGYTSFSLEDYDVIEELYMWYLLLIRVLCTFLHGCLLVLIEEKAACYLSSCFVGLSLF